MNHYLVTVKFPNEPYDNEASKPKEIDFEVKSIIVSANTFGEAELKIASLYSTDHVNFNIVQIIILS